MKELSIEEKAKAYDELKVKARQIYNKENDVLIIHTIEDLFPELKESEDERIRKDILAFIKRQGQHIDKYKWHKWLAWLEFLKDKYTWTPSDEQIMALRWVLNHIPYDSHKEEISGLLEQLKKLRED